MDEITVEKSLEVYIFIFFEREREREGRESF